MRPVPLILNPVAGGGRARRAAARVVAVLRQRGVSSTVLETRGPGDALRLAAGLAAAGEPLVAACGGDGTQHEVAAGLAGSGTALGILPSGRGNDLAAALGIPPNPGAAAETLLAGRVRRIDLGEANGRPFCTVASTGFDAEVANRTRGGAWRHLGPLAYPLGVLACLARFRAPHLRISGDFGVREGRYLLVAASNTGIYGGGVRVAPDSSPDDGLFDCCLIRDVPWWKLLALFPRAYFGGHVSHPAVEIVRCQALRIEADRTSPVIADGESCGATPVDFRIRQGALAVMVPAGPAPAPA